MHLFQFVREDADLLCFCLLVSISFTSMIHGSTKMGNVWVNLLYFVFDVGYGDDDDDDDDV